MKTLVQSLAEAVNDPTQPSVDMQFNYGLFVRQLFRNRAQGEDGLMHAAVGIAGEAGEILDNVKKTWVYNKPLDVENIREELGDLEFYMEALRNLAGLTREECVRHNTSKLVIRYPNGYTDKAAIERADKQ